MQLIVFILRGHVKAYFQNIHENSTQIEQLEGFGRVGI